MGRLRIHFNIANINMGVNGQTRIPMQCPGKKQRNSEIFDKMSVCLAANILKCSTVFAKGHFYTNYVNTVWLHQSFYYHNLLYFLKHCTKYRLY